MMLFLYEYEHIRVETTGSPYQTIKDYNKVLANSYKLST